MGALLDLVDRADAQLFQVVWSSLRPSLSRIGAVHHAKQHKSSNL
jgi:hypothetical protein